VLGICFGHQIISKELGGKVKQSKSREFGLAKVKKVKESILTKDFFTKNENNVWMSHADEVTRLPKDFKVIGKTNNAKLCIVENTKKKLFGIQFHPEVTHTNRGKIILRNFVFKICKIKRNWSSRDQKLKLIKQVKNQVGNSKVICALSGGVDSSVVAKLLSNAIGKRLTCIFVNTGLLRKNEEKQVVHTFKKRFKINLVYVNAEKQFLNKLKNITDPEKKRKIIGNLFIKVFQKHAKKMDNIKFLAQGTLYPDVIESVSVNDGPSVTIKSHHNVGGLPKRMGLKLIEPLRNLFKDEVRKLGNELNLPKTFINRHPFPGPGLAIRCPGEVTIKKVKILQNIDEIFIDQIKKYNLYDEIWQAFSVLLPTRSVGVMGDKRTYDYACVLRAVTSVDGMTADYFKFDQSFLSDTSTRIINEVSGVNRVTYDITSKPPGTIEWE
jgi:GMP synthase (glutamine-hydrolysing)